MNNVVVFAPLFPPAFRGGGPIRSTAALVANTPPGIVPYVITSDRDLGVVERLPVTANQWVSANGADCWFASVDKLNSYRRALFAARAVGPKLVYLNSVMNPRFAILPLVLSKLGFWKGALLLVAPRGEFGAAALSHKALKKKIYLALMRLFGLQKNVVWHSTAPHESVDIRALWGDSARIVERQNDSLARPPSGQRAPGGVRVRAVFISRLTELKGLHVLLQALAGVVHPVTLDVYGPEEVPAYASYCRSLARRLPANITVNFVGPVSPDRVVTELQKNDIFMFPTAGENFGHVVAEALAAGCQVMITPNTPWTKAIADGGGVVVGTRDPDQWTEAINEFCNRSPDERYEGSLAAQATFRDWSSRDAEPHLWTSAMNLVQETT